MDSQINIDMNQSKKAEDKKRLIIYILIAYGITYLMGIFMWIGNSKGCDLTVFPSAQMLYPAAGVILGLLLTNKGNRNLPKGFFVIELAVTGVLIIMAICSVFIPVKELVIQGTSISVYNIASQYALIIASILGLIFLITAGKEKRAQAGLTRKNGKMVILIVIMFIAIYMARTIFSTLLSGFMNGEGLKYTTSWFALFKDPKMWFSILALPINYFFVFIAFFGEEYGWRYYLQPVMQKKFGLRLGVILLGVVWGIWHLPIDLFYYTQTSGIQMIFSQQITCITLGIFFAYAYMKTNNIWVVVCLHFLNNNLVPIITGTFTSDVLENQVVNWSDIPIALLINGICFGLFIFANVFKKKNKTSEL